MLLLGHAGITLGASIILGGLLSRARADTIDTSEKPGVSPKLADPHNKRQPFDSYRIDSLAAYIDIRILLVGSLLPDIIDKPVGLFFFRDAFSNGRIFSHTLLFLIIITIAGLLLYRHSGKNWLLVLSFGVFMHFILDAMWTQPRTLLWPLFGIAFDRKPIDRWLLDIIAGLIGSPGIYFPEIIGAVILFWFVIVLVHRRTLFAFILHNTVQ